MKKYIIKIKMQNKIINNNVNIEIIQSEKLRRSIFHEKVLAYKCP
jgi:hypothetical protein